MSLEATTWVPGFEQHLAAHGDGGAYTDERSPKLLWHTSETAPGSLAGIIADMLAKNHTDVYHTAADPKLRRVAQFLPLNISASALAHPPAVETNHDGAIQVCIIGRAADMPNLSASDLEWLGTAVLAPIAKCVPELHIDTSVIFYGADCGFTLATTTARQRMTPAAWLAFNGHAGHQHVPGNDHWDPGHLDVHAITAAAHTVLNPTGNSTSTEATEDDMLYPARTKAANVWSGLEVRASDNFIGTTGDCHPVPPIDAGILAGLKTNPVKGSYLTGPGKVTVVQANKAEMHFDLP